MTLPLEKATYHAIAIATTLGSSKEKGTKYVAVNFEIVDDENFFGETPPAWLGYFSDKTSERTIESLQHMGYQGDSVEDFANLDREGCARLLPSTVEIVCDTEEYDGKIRLRVQWVNRLGGGRFKAEKPLEGGELKAFAAQMKSAFRNARGPRPAAQSNKQTTRQYSNAPYSKDDSDIPF